MTNQDKKAWLNRYKQLNGAINQKVDELSRLRALCEKATAVMSDMPKGGNAAKEDTYIRMIDMAREINSEIDHYADLRQEIVGAISTVREITLQTILGLRYIDGLTFEQVAVSMNYCYMHICRLHGDALEKININTKEGD